MLTELVNHFTGIPDAWRAKTISREREQALNDHDEGSADALWYRRWMYLPLVSRMVFNTLTGTALYKAVTAETTMERALYLTYAVAAEAGRHVSRDEWDAYMREYHGVPETTTIPAVSASRDISAD